MLSGQLAAFAIHYSVLYHVSKIEDSHAEISAALSSALWTVAACAAATAILLWSLRDSISQLLNSPAVAVGLNAAAIGIFFFPLNKVLLTYLNARRRMWLYAIGNAGRYVLMLFILSAMHIKHVPGAYFPLCLAVSESLLFAMLMLACLPHLRRLSINEFRDWSRKHLRFGAKGVAGGMLADLNTRIDILVLGLMADDRAVGIYSLASVFAEGLFLLNTTLRLNFDPMIARLYHTKQWDALHHLVSTGKRMGYLGMIGIGGIAILLFPWVLEWITHQADYSESWPVFAVLAIGIILASGYIPFGGMLQQGGHPGSQSLLTGLIVVTNLVGNLVLIPWFGAMGAAVGTAISQVLFVPYLVWLVRRRLGFRL